MAQSPQTTFSTPIQNLARNVANTTALPGAHIKTASKIIQIMLITVFSNCVLNNPKNHPTGTNQTTTMLLIAMICHDTCQTKLATTIEANFKKVTISTDIIVAAKKTNIPKSTFIKKTMWCLNPTLLILLDMF
jgi:hypothetical protein